ncbi:MAG: NADH-quinone oxidoreductase subunit H [Eubacteriales bacterium]|nr:NADH-quinone oxidoreductase subunit H [Eubacteriales bacterium]MDD3199298.1 NADH-quinone oxidoreductase subunit H [Eubacteriales bacterium]MDD4121297.1 NADH-quinone oxidoreductase subunit H [Eubacteriales bacterium]MDD4629428.1 NADH-quinone oxidoreductase subunit H [Eubacteriales bacterium]
MNLTTSIIGITAYLILAPVAGGLLAGIDRKISARMQGRFGPPILQPFYDFFKLLEKEPITVNKVQDFYVMCFLLFIIITGCFFFAGGDLLLVIFTLTLASVFLVVAAFSSNSPYAQVGAERELLQMMAYEPMALLTAVGFYLVNGSFNVADAVTSQVMAIQYLPGIFLGFVFILTIKLRKSPFDLSMSHHAHQELVKGLTTEFSGKTMAFIEIAHWYENIFLLGIVYMFIAYSAVWSPVIAVIVCFAIYFLEILIDNNYARMKWQIALNSSWVVALTFGFVNLLILYFIG